MQSKITKVEQASTTCLSNVKTYVMENENVIAPDLIVSNIMTNLQRLNFEINEIMGSHDTTVTPFEFWQSIGEDFGFEFFSHDDFIKIFGLIAVEHIKMMSGKTLTNNDMFNISQNFLFGSNATQNVNRKINFMHYNMIRNAAISIEN